MTKKQVLKSATGKTSKDKKTSLRETLATVLSNYVELRETEIEYYKASESLFERLEAELVMSKTKCGIIEAGFKAQIDEVSQCNKVVTDRNIRIKELEDQLCFIKQSRDCWLESHREVSKRLDLERQKSLWQHFKDACRRAWEPAE